MISSKKVTPELIPLELSPFTMKPRQRHIPAKSNTHPFLFTLMTLTAAAELGLTAFLISAGNSIGTSRYHSLSVLPCIRGVVTDRLCPQPDFVVLRSRLDAVVHYRLHALGPRRSRSTSGEYSQLCRMAAVDRDLMGASYHRRIRVLVLMNICCTGYRCRYNAQCSWRR